VRRGGASLSLGALAVMRALSLITALVVAGCSDTHIENYPKTVSDGLTSIPCATDFATLFPRAQHTISYYSARRTPPKWNSKAGIADRYVLTMQIPITLDRAAGRVTSSGTPEFYLNEVTAVSQLPDGRFQISYGRNIRFGLPEWQSFRDRHADLSVFGIAAPITPVPRFNEITNDS